MDICCNLIIDSFVESGLDGEVCIKDVWPGAYSRNIVILARVGALLTRLTRASFSVFKYGPGLRVETLEMNSAILGIVPCCL